MRVRTVPPLSEAEFALKKLKRLGCTAHQNRMSDLRLDHELDLKAEGRSCSAAAFEAMAGIVRSFFPCTRSTGRRSASWGTGFIGWRPENAITTPIIAQL